MVPRDTVGRAGRRLLVGLAFAAALAGPLGAQVPARHVDEEAVHAIASQLRCVVCQNLSVADSPSEMASQMRTVVRERLAAGDSPDAVRQYFVDRYGEWILLAPRREGFTLLVWVLPPLALAAGLVLAGLLLRRWTGAAARRRVPPAPVDAAMSERIRRELEAEP